MLPDQFLQKKMRAFIRKTFFETHSPVVIQRTIWYGIVYVTSVDSFAMLIIGIENEFNSEQESFIWKTLVLRLEMEEDHWDANEQSILKLSRQEDQCHVEKYHHLLSLDF